MNNNSITRYTESIIKKYPNRLEHIQLKHPVISNGENLKKSSFKEKTPENQQKIDEENLERSLRRTQKELSDLIECNDFDFFGTLTTSPHKINRYDDELVKTTLTKWLNNQRRHSPNFIYILVPERHKDGALHFHVLIGNFNGKMADSGRKWLGEPIFNLSSYSLGFSNFTKIRDKSKTANYCRKYITKDLATTENQKRRYWRSKNLKKPDKYYNIPLEQLISHHATRNLGDLNVYENDHLVKVSFPHDTSLPFPLKGSESPLHEETPPPQAYATT